MKKIKKVFVYLFKLFADEREGFVDGVGVAGHSHNPLRAGPVADVDLGAALELKVNHLEAIGLRVGYPVGRVK